MFRIGSVCCALSLAAVASVASANEDKHKETCRVTADIVRLSVTHRAQGEDVDAVKDIFMTGNTAVAEKYQPTVGPIVDWVFSLETAVIEGSGAANAVAKTYHESCLGYKP